MVLIIIELLVIIGLVVMFIVKGKKNAEVKVESVVSEVQPVVSESVVPAPAGIAAFVPEGTFADFLPPSLQTHPRTSAAGRRPKSP